MQLGCAMGSKHFSAAEEAFDDYGCPHTLEHLIFLGSDRYPYKGANGCFCVRQSSCLLTKPSGISLSVSPGFSFGC